MRRIIVVVIALITGGYILLHSTDSVMSEDCPPVGDYKPGEVIITFKPEYMPAAFDVTASPPSVGMSAIDSIFLAVDANHLVKLIPTYDVLTTTAGQSLERTFLLAYGSEDDPIELAVDLAERVEFERVAVNKLWQFELHGTKRLVPPSGTTQFGLQWYMDDVTDLSDVDAPEAWIIEEGDPSVVVGIYDSGTMLDMCVNPWRLHSDMTYYFVPGEDHVPTGQLTSSDLSGMTDDDDEYADNVIGTNVTDGCGSPQEPCGTDDQARTWTELPIDWVFQIQPPPRVGCPLPPTSWEIEGSNDHGTRVGSIAVGMLDGLKAAHPNDEPPFTHKDIVGIAHGCKVLNARIGCPNGDFDAARALLMLAEHCRVINMSFGVSVCNQFSPGGSFFSDAVDAVTSEPSYDCVLVSSTGNGNLDDTINYPAIFDSVLAVGAISRTSAGGIPLLNWYSNYSDTAKLVDLVAPTEESPLNIPAGTQGIFTNRHTHVSSVGGSCGVLGPFASPTETVAFSELGTSFAAPQVTGVAALVRSRFPGLNQFQVKQRLKRAAEHYAAWGATRPSYEYGYGKVNAYRALTEWGSITTNAAWSPTTTRDGKYYISGDLTIEPSATLTIVAGTIVKIAPDHEQLGADAERVQFIVKGTLNITGTAANPVVFESFHDGTPGGADWIGIKFEAGSSGTISNVVFKNAVRAIENYAPLTGTSSITNCRFTQCGTAIDAHANANIVGGLIADNGIAVNAHAGTITMSNCTVAKNTTSATVVTGSASISINTSIVAFHNGPAVQIVTPWTGSQAMQKSVVYENAELSGSRTDADWEALGQTVVDMNPAFCSPLVGNYSLNAASPAVPPVPPDQGYFGEKAGAFGIGCAPSATVAVVPAGEVFATCPKDDGAETVRIDVTLSGVGRTIGADELRLDIPDFVATVFDQDGYLLAASDATGPNYATKIEHKAFGGRSSASPPNFICSSGDAVDVLLNGYPLSAQAAVTIRSPDLNGNGTVNIVDGALFSQGGFPQDPAPPNDCRDFNGDGRLQLEDWAIFGAHNNHTSEYQLWNAPTEVTQSNASVTFRFTEEYPTATTHRLIVDVDVEDFTVVTTAVFSVAARNVRLSFVEWRNADSAIGDVAFAPVMRDGEEQLYFGVFVSEAFTGSGAGLGELVFDVTGMEPFEVIENQFVLVSGEVLQETAASGPVVAFMEGAFSVAFDPDVARVYHNRLEQNFPNPFNPTTTLAYSLKNAQNVNLSIYDVAGRRVRELVNERKEKGAYKVVWDGRNDQGVAVASGVYFYKLVASSFTDTKKMTILK